jgi:bifunctional UDP-N-acetylglucosamine pyrophosphorylase/glucosamine-1-phosphate N-acetyltransferase
MKSSTPKVLHEVAGRSLVGHVLAAVDQLNPHELVVVVGHGRERVSEHVRASHPHAVLAVQEQQHGTGHAVRIALEQLSEAGIALAEGPIVVLAGDTPLLTGATLAELVELHESQEAAASVLTAILNDPSGYGRIIRDGDGGRVTRIVEHKDASDDERAVREINSGVYAFRPSSLTSGLARLTTDNVQGEEYLTDVLGHLVGDGDVVVAQIAADPDEILGVNDRVQLAVAGGLLRDRINIGWMREGVTIVDPSTTWIDFTVQLDRDVRIERNTSLHGATRVASNAVVGPDTSLDDCVIAEGAHVFKSHLTQAKIGANATVGPYTFMRPGTELAARAKVGAYVETKNAVIGEGAKVPHLSYVGDAEIGAGTNIGAATITVNYDGVDKHRTVVGDHVRIGSDSMLVAPVTIGDGAYTAAGSVITDDVPAGAMAVGRARQRNIEGWVERKRPNTASAAAAKAAESPRTESTDSSNDASSTSKEHE